MLSYVQLHQLKDSIHNQKSLVNLILDDNTDDLIGSFRDDQETINYITEIQNKVFHNFNHLVIEYKELRRKYFQDFAENRKEFALKHKDNELFSFVMKYLNTSFRDVEQIAEKSVKEHIQRLCKTRSDAEKYLEEL